MQAAVDGKGVEFDVDRTVTVDPGRADALPEVFRIFTGRFDNGVGVECRFVVRHDVFLSGG